MSSVILKIAPSVATPDAPPARLSHSRAVTPVLATDPRWVLAVRTAQWLQGGRAAILTPEHRRRILGLAQHIGLRPFDASLVIAIVQDAVRCGQEPLGRAAEARLSMIRTASSAGPAVPPAALLLASALVALLIWAGLVAWIGG
jgi:hypothetical protein